MAGKGAKNPMWRGGVSPYPNHGELKRNRLAVLNLHKWICEICGEKANQTHHKDFGKTNHCPSNLQAVCGKCHTLIHKQNPKWAIQPHLTANSFFGLRGRTPLKIQRFMLLYGKGLSERTERVNNYGFPQR